MWDPVSHSCKRTSTVMILCVVRVTLVIRAFVVRGFISVLLGPSISYPRPNFKARYLRWTLFWLIRERDAGDMLGIKEFDYKTKQSIIRHSVFIHCSVQILQISSVFYVIVTNLQIKKYRLFGIASTLHHNFWVLQFASHKHICGSRYKNFSACNIQTRHACEMILQA